MAANIYDYQPMQAGRADLRASVLHLLYPQAMAWTSEPLGVDVSTYQGVVDWAAVASKGVKFAYIRAGMSWGYEDPQFRANRDGAEANGILWGAYHVLYPDQVAADQVLKLADILGDRWGNLPPAWDLERVDGQSKATINAKAYDVLTRTSEYIGRACVAYSAGWFLNNYMTPASWWNDYDWWLAQYLYPGLDGFADEHPGPLTMPNGIDTDSVVIHQTAGKARGKSAGYGVQSENIDLDRWIQGGMASLLSWAGVQDEPAPEPGLVTDEAAGQAVDTLARYFAQNITKLNKEK